MWPSVVMLQLPCRVSAGIPVLTEFSSMPSSNASAKFDVVARQLFDSLEPSHSTPQPAGLTKYTMIFLPWLYGRAVNDEAWPRYSYVARHFELS